MQLQLLKVNIVFIQITDFFWDWYSITWSLIIGPPVGLLGGPVAPLPPPSSYSTGYVYSKLKCNKYMNAAQRSPQYINICWVQSKNIARVSPLFDADIQLQIEFHLQPDSCLAGILVQSRIPAKHESGGNIYVLWWPLGSIQKGTMTYVTNTCMNAAQRLR